MCNKKIVFVVFVFSVFCFIMLGHPLSFAEEKAFDEAGINYFIQKLFYKNGDQRREKKDQGDMLKCATPILKYAFAHKELILPQNRFIFYSPMSLYKYEYFGSAEIWHYESPGGNFKIHYTEDNSHGDAVDGSDGIKETVPDYVKRLATFFDNVWTRVVYEMGYEAPEFNSYKPGAEPGVFDVYLKNINAYGYTIFDFEPPYIVIHKDLNFDHYTNDDPEGTQIGNMKVTAAHEFFHIIQYNYNFWSSESISFSISNQWWEESTAVWIEDIVFDEVNDYIRYLPDTFENFNLSLDFNSSDFGSFNYGEVIWPIFLSETYGQGIILDIFNRCKQIYPPLAKTAIGDIFEVYNSSWDEALSQFYLKNLIRDYEEGERFPKIYENSKCLDDIVYSYQIERGYSSLNNGPLDHLSCNYMKFEPGIRSKNLNLTLLTPENTISPITILIGDKSSSGGPTKYTIDSYSWRHSDMDFILNRFGAMDVYKYAYLIIINSDPTDKNCFYNIGANYLQILSQYLSIDKPLPGDIIVVNEGITSVPLTLSVNNLPPDPSDPQRSLKYNFELYKSPGSPPFYSDTLDEETAGVTSLEINVYQGFGGYYWRCQAESQDRSKSMWTSLAFFYIQPVREILAQEVTPGHEFKVEVLTPESSIYGTSVEGIFEGNEDQEIIIAEAVPPDVDTGNIAPVGEWIYIAPHGLVLSESSCIKLTYTDRELYDAGLTDPNALSIYELQNIDDPNKSLSLIKLKSLHDLYQKTISAYVEHLSLYVLGFDRSEIKPAYYPVVVSILPSDREKRVPVDTPVTIRFSRQMDRLSVEENINIYNSFGDEINGVFKWSDTVYQDDTVTFILARNFAYNQGIGIKIPGSCRDAIRHYKLNGYGKEDLFDFATQSAPGDDSPPEILAEFPYKGQIGGYTNMIGAIFSKPLDPATITNDNVILRGSNIYNYTVEFYFDKLFLKIIPSYTPAPYTDLTVILTTSLTDTDGRPLAAEYQWSFNTGPHDGISPVIIQTQPSEIWNKIMPQNSIEIYFSENMETDTINNTSIKVYDEITHEFKEIYILKQNADEKGSRSRISITPLSDNMEWEIGHTYKVIADQAISDLAGNPLDADYSFSFAVVDSGYAPWIEEIDCLGIKNSDSSTKIYISVRILCSHDQNLNVIARDLTQQGKIWELTKIPDRDYFEYKSSEDEGLINGYHDIEFIVTDSGTGNFVKFKWNFFIFSATPSLTFPENGSNKVPARPTFSWNSNGTNNDAEFMIYKIYILDPDSSDENKPEFIWSQLTAANDSPSYAVTLPVCRTLGFSTTYCWGILTFDNTNWEQGLAYSQQWSFTTIDESAEVLKTGFTSNYSEISTIQCAPFEIQFINNSVNANSYYWDFGDFTNSIEKNPSHVYEIPGTYTITLMAANEFIQDIHMQTIEVTPFCYSITNNYRVVWGDALIREMPVEPGDWIGIFTPEVKINNGCIGAVKVSENMQYVLPVYGDDIATYEKDGAQMGDSFTFKAWDKSEKGMVDLDAIGPDNHLWYEDNKMLYINIISAINPIKQLIPLAEGWNLISFQILKCFYDEEPPSLSITDPAKLEFEAKESLKNWLINDQNSPLRDAADTDKAGDWQKIISFDEEGAHMLDKNIPDFTATLNYISFGYGYWIKMNKPGILIINGKPANNDIPFTPKKGWNLLGFIPPHICYVKNKKIKANICPYYNNVYQKEENILYCPVETFEDTVFKNLTEKYRSIISFDTCNGAMLFDKELPDYINTFYYLGPKYGYWVKMLNEGEITFSY